MRLSCRSSLSRILVNCVVLNRVVVFVHIYLNSESESSLFHFKFNIKMKRIIGKTA